MKDVINAQLKKNMELNLLFKQLEIEVNIATDTLKIWVNGTQYGSTFNFYNDLSCL